MTNLYIAGGSVFPTGGYANPSLTIVALSLSARRSPQIDAETRSPAVARRGRRPCPGPDPRRGRAPHTDGVVIAPSQHDLGWVVMRKVLARPIGNSARADRITTHLARVDPLTISEPRLFQEDQVGGLTIHKLGPFWKR